MPKGVLWHQDDIYVSAMGGTPFGAPQPHASYDAIAEHVRSGDGQMTLLVVAPFMHGNAQWSSFYTISGGGTVVLADDNRHFSAADTLDLVQREQVISIPVVGDAMALPLVEEVERAAVAGTPYDLSSVAAVNNGGAPLSPGLRGRLLEAIPHVILLDGVGSSETGIQMSAVSVKGAEVAAATFAPQADTAVLDDSLPRVLRPREGGGWLARRDRVPLGYLGDPDKTARTFPTVDGVRWAVPGDRADVLDDGRIVLLGRDNITINSGGEKIFAEEVERAMIGHPAVRDVIVVGRPSHRWGSEVVAVVELQEGAAVDDAELLAECGRHVARYKTPKAVVRVDRVLRSPTGKADYRWAKQVAIDGE
jgi:fatty-acyl-CoA synthase